MGGQFWVVNNPLVGYSIRDIGRSPYFFYAVGRQQDNNQIYKPAYFTSVDEINFNNSVRCNECGNGDYGQRLVIFDTIAFLVTGSFLESPSAIYRKLSSQTVWQPIGGGSSIQTHFVSATYGYYCSYGAPNSNVYATSNGGTNWVQDTLPGFQARNIFFVNNSTGFVVGENGLIAKTTNGGGVIGIQQISSEIPRTFLLNQNYPNPFNPVTNIKFDIIAKSKVRLIVYDVLGSEITSLVDEELQAGSYNVDWNAFDYSSGVYFYRLETDKYTETKKMVLLK